MSGEVQGIELLFRIPPSKLIELFPHLNKHFPGLFGFDSPERLFPLSIERDSSVRTLSMLFDGVLIPSSLLSYNCKYICCDINRFMGSTRSPWTGVFHPSVSDPPLLKEQHRQLEELLNAAFSYYVKSYYHSQDTVTSVYCLGRDVGILICALIKSPLVDIVYLIDVKVSCRHSHLFFCIYFLGFHTKQRLVGSAIYNLSVVYAIKLMKDEFSTTEIDDLCFSFYLRQNRTEEAKVSANINEAHVKNIGVLIEAHSQRLDGHLRTCEHLSRWAASNIRDVRRIRLLLMSLLDRSTADSSETDAQEEGRQFDVSSEVNDVEASIRKIKLALDNLDKSAIKSKKQMDNRSLLPYNLVLPLDQMDVQVEDGDSLRRVDWLVGRNEACRWLRRTNYRTEAIQLSLASCGRFMRNTTLVPLSSAMDLRNLAAPHMSFALIEPNSRNPILYVKVGDIMHCLISFGNLCMENIIVRGLDESHCAPGYTPRSRTANSGPFSRVSQAMSDLLCSRVISGFSANLLPNADNISDSVLPTASQLDLTTPSRHVTFVRVTEAARNALVHFATTTEPPTQLSALHQFCDWLQTYTRLFTEPCASCEQLLGQDAALPVLRTFHTNPANARAQHEQCRVNASPTAELFLLHIDVHKFYSSIMSSFAFVDESREQVRLGNGPYSGFIPQNRLKYIQSEHFSRLVSKQNSETELLEDMRYALKWFISQEFLHRSVWDIWKSFLREFNALALSHLKLAEVHHRLSLEFKPIKSLRVSVSKRIFEQLKSLQNDLAASMQEMVKSQKIYSEEEKQAHETRLKAMNIEDKLRRRSTNLFNSMAQLHRNHVKISQRRDECENRSAGARNEYLFQLTAINAHLDHYLKTDIPDLAQILDGDVYDRFREVLSKTSEMELDICRHHQDPFKTLLEESSKINRTTAWENFIKESPIFSVDVEFHFEPRDGDTISSLLSVNAKEGSFDQVAKKLARRFVTRERRIKSYRDEINDLCSGRISPSPGMSVSLSQQVPPPPRKFPLKDYDANEESGALNQEYVENKVEELEFAIRREEIEKTKISACLELLKKTHGRLSFLNLTLNTLCINAIIKCNNHQRKNHFKPCDEYRWDRKPSCAFLLLVDVQAALYEANLAAAEVEAATAGGGTTVAEKTHHGASSSSTAATGSSSTEGSTVGLTGLLTESGQHRSSALLEGSFVPLNSASRSRTQNGGVSRTSAQQLANEAWARVTLTPANVTTAGENYEPSFIQLDDEDPLSQQQSSRREPSPEVDWTGGGRLPKATAMYEFLAARSDEINMVCNEQVVLLGTGDGEDWVKVRSLLDGKEGLVPRAFLSIDPTPPPAPPHPSVPTLIAQSDTEQDPHDKTSSPPASSPSDLAASTHPPMSQRLAGQFVRALIDFAGTADDELSFGVGAVIHVLGRRAVGEVDDGWIEGELVPLTDAETSTPPPRGVFPSMLVEIVPAEESWKRRLGACRPRSAKALLSTGFPADTKTSPISERRCKLLSSSGSVPSPRSSNSGNRSKSRSASAKRSWSGGAGGGQRRSTVSHLVSSSQRSLHRHHQQQHHEHQGRETSAGHGRASHTLITTKVNPSQASPTSPPPPEANVPGSICQQHEFSSVTPNGEVKHEILKASEESLSVEAWSYVEDLFGKARVGRIRSNLHNQEEMKERGSMEYAPGQHAHI
ncbi:unnamed protein product [Hydatigera taeniaeformis]|uniref:Protein kinase domain-containing protein n=1 Tax=Hydatigena taeniaeformis TaxID=6205 RepID=A0A158RD75_HYDTA|nr:unnamed protein product [Hydatigera taeniaeformis]